jgi:hypothetical protein
MNINIGGDPGDGPPIWLPFLMVALFFVGLFVAALMGH